jgi:GWxTD domain-containing protein
MRLLDAADVYRALGFYVSGPPLPFVGSVRYLRAAASDSTLALCALSLSNHALSFRRDGNEFLAEYHVEVSFRPDSGPPRQVASDQVVRVRGFQETLRNDETVIYQQLLTLRPGVYHVSTIVRDRNGPAVGRYERLDTVPSFATRGLSSPVAFYEGTGRAAVGELPKLVANPRATLPYGGDTLRFYVEGYDLAEGARLAVRAVDQGGVSMYDDTVPLRGGPGLAHAVVSLAPGRLPMGEAHLELEAVGAGAGGGASTRAPFLVSFSSQWVITNFAEMIGLLRYFDHPDLVDSLRKATPERRPEVWRQFWKQTDPVPLTPENEALDDYFKRVQVANQRYAEAGDPGWLTDRGEVYITLGEPDEVYDLRGDVSRGGTAVVRWSYTTLQLVLIFADQTGFGRFRLTPTSRADYQRVLSRVRRAS